MKTASNSRVLKKRLRRFLEDVPDERLEISEILRKLEPIAKVYIFGGVLRDIALYGVPKFSSDIDIVAVPLDNDEFEVFLASYKAVRNKFGGFRIHLNRWFFDIWEFDKTWAFSTNHVSPMTKHSLVETTFFNWDAIFYDYENNKIICDDDYFSDLLNLELDINLESNPNKIGALVRSMKFINKDGAATKPNLTHFIKKVLASETNEGILAYANRENSSATLNEPFIEMLREKIAGWDEESTMYWLAPDQLSLPLHNR